jgi:hypothetical protein
MKSGLNVSIWPFSSDSAIVRIVVGGIMVCGMAGVAGIASAKSLALGTRYIYQPPANYEHTRSETDAQKLTDGQFAKGHFWTSRGQTVGWYQSGAIRVEVDLAASYDVDEVCANTARGSHAGVSFPDRIDVFVSLDQRNYAYAGDLMRGKNHEDGDYLVKKFCASDLGISARYVMFVFQPRGDYTFVDEIEMFGDEARRGQTHSDVAPELKRDEIPSLQENLVQGSHYATSLAAMAGGLLALTTELTKSDQSFSKIGAAIEALLATLNGDGDHPDIAVLKETVEPELLALHRRVLARRFDERLILWRKDPWSVFTPLDSPDPDARLEDGLQLDLMRRGTDSDAVILTNNTDKTEDYRIFVRPNVAAEGAPAIKLREVVPILLANGTTRGDALVDLAADGLSIRAGESKQLWLSASAQDAPAGEYFSKIDVVPADPAQPVRAIPLNLKVWAVGLPQHQRLNVNAWSYLGWRPIRHIPEKAVADLLAHHVNVFVLHESEVPWPSVRSAAGSYSPPDYARFDRFVRLHKGAERLLFYLEFKSHERRTFGGRLAFMSEPWKALFRAWIRDWTSHAMALGLSYADFAFYPVDEPEGGAQTAYLLDTVNVIKEVDPKLQAYTTLGRLGGMDLVRAARLVDIFQVPVGELSGLNVSVLKAFNRDIWSYTGGGKEADPLTSYRRQAWRAFQAGATGIGFWAYADTGPRGTAWNDIDGTRPDPAVIYEGKDDVVSSKRWEAWRAGIEDYELLCIARDKLRARKPPGELGQEVTRAMTGGYRQFQQTRRHLLSIAGT